MEYPGYSVYAASSISEELIIKDSETVMAYLLAKCKVPLARIIIAGRSLGSGPACWLSTKFCVAALILISPFTSIKDVASEHYGVFGKLLIKDRFNNVKNIKKTQCPTLLIHGHEDTMVPVNHSQTLNGRRG